MTRDTLFRLFVRKRGVCHAACRVFWLLPTFYDTVGEENVEVFHSAFTPLEWQLNSQRPQNACYVKVIVSILTLPARNVDACDYITYLCTVV